MSSDDDWVFETREQAASRARAAFEAAEGERRSLAELLVARGHRNAAAVVVLSSMDSDLLAFLADPTYPERSASDVPALPPMRD